MSRRRNYSEQSLRIIGRYFEALSACIDTKRLKNLSKYCEAYEIDRRHLYSQRNDVGRGYFEAGWLQSLVDCGVSASWLLTGKGKMFI